MTRSAQVEQRTCSSRVVQTINAPRPLVWSVLRRFDKPQVFKKLIQSCTLLSGSGEVGSVRQVYFRSGFPGNTSVERLERLDEEEHVSVHKVIDGDHKLVNFHVTTLLQELVDNGDKRTLVVEAYTVDVPSDSNEVDTCYVANTIIQFNLKSLANLVERMANKTKPTHQGEKSCWLYHNN